MAIKFVRPGLYEVHDTTRLRAEIIRSATSGRWAVMRRNSKGEFSGINGFRTLAEARDFVLNRPGIWGNAIL